MTEGSAAEAWNRIWSTSEGRDAWRSAEPEIVDLARSRYRDRAARQALDLGCGIGRHALALARVGYEVHATDLAAAGLAQLRRAAEREKLSVTVREAACTDLPFDDAAFDLVVAFNVVHHGHKADVAASFAEIRRILRIGGVVHATLLSKRSAATMTGIEVSPDTYIWEHGEGDHRHPHCFCDRSELEAMLAGCDWLFIEERQVTDLPEYYHWHFAAERRR